MAKNPSVGVVDEHGRVHGVPNLLIASSSTFPTSSQATPTLTIIALAARMADFLNDQSSQVSESITGAKATTLSAGCSDF
jgi:choline dehydrogenase-like flavoprotein